MPQGRDSRYDILFEPLAIGPITARNRFSQAPHCNGGYRGPSAAAAMHVETPEDGRSVIYSGPCGMHHTSEITAFIALRLREDKDMPMRAWIAGKIKAHGALARIQMACCCIHRPHLDTREVPRAVSPGPVSMERHRE